MEKISKNVLPGTMGYEWSGLSLEEISAGSQTYVIFGLGVLCLFLILAAQYESLVAPFIILFSVPLAILGALVFNFLRMMPNDIFTQIGLVMLVGLSSKNGILIVEFANQIRKEQGLTAKEAVIKAAGTRLRPILMTSFAFIFGLLPLLFSAGAGALARHSLGTAVIGGMLFATVLNLFVIPVFYVLFVRDPKGPEEAFVPSFEEGNYSVTEVFDEETPDENENGKKAGLINYINEDQANDASPQTDDLAEGDGPEKAQGDTPAGDKEKK
jgi:HAE1 family hydrophobic/amphiphilic exporter-1